MRSLSDTELLPAQGRSRGLSRREIAHRLNLGEESVKSHLHAVYSKLAVPGKRDLRRWCDVLEAEGKQRRLAWDEVPERRGANGGR